MDTSEHPPVVYDLHFIFEGWLGDELVECFPVFLATVDLCDEILQEALTGCEIKNCEIEYSDQFVDLHPTTLLPSFKWLAVNGRNGDDFCISEEYKLRVSQKALNLLKKYSLSHCDISKVEQ